MIATSKIPSTYERSVILYYPSSRQPRYQLTHRCVLADQQVGVKEVIDEEWQSVHLACKSEDKGVSLVAPASFLYPTR